MTQAAEETGRRPTFEDAVKASDLTREEQQMLDGSAGEPPDPEQVQDDMEEASLAPVDGAVPAWVVMPEDFKMPDGRVAKFLRFRASWTDTPTRGDRQCVLWNLTEADEKRALKRTRGEALRTIDEFTKQMIRVVDGKKADWERGDFANVNKFWDEIGGKCRSLLKGVYVKNHTLNAEESADFFSNCIAARTVGG